MRRKKTTRTHRLIGFKAYEDTDSDLIDWWDGIPEGERSDVLREMIRSYRNSRPRLTARGIEQVAEDTAWLRMAINDMPAYIERILKEVGSRAPVATPQTTPVQPVEPSLSEQDKARRANRLNKASW